MPSEPRPSYVETLRRNLYETAYETRPEIDTFIADLRAEIEELRAEAVRSFAERVRREVERVLGEQERKHRRNGDLAIAEAQLGAVLALLGGDDR